LAKFTGIAVSLLKPKLELHSLLWSELAGL